MKKFIAIIFFILPVAWSFNNVREVSVQSVFAAEESWRTEFDRVCGQSDSAADMSAEELKKAIAGCDALKPQIEALEPTPRKVYLKRLQMCRNLLAFLLESKENKK